MRRKVASPLRAAAFSQARRASAWSPAWRRFQPSATSSPSSHGLAFTARWSIATESASRAARAARRRAPAEEAAARAPPACGPTHTLACTRKRTRTWRVPRVTGAGVDEATRVHERMPLLAIDHGAVVLEPRPAAAVLARVAQPDVHRQQREVGVHRQRVVPARGVVLDDERLVHAQPIGAEPKLVGRRRQDAVDQGVREEGAARRHVRHARLARVPGERAARRSGPPPARPPARRRARSHVAGGENGAGHALSSDFRVRRVARRDGVGPRTAKRSHPPS